ncbi:unnamed protein product, partial [Timema podura]|nr:unnamed protein product [Timema podura]
GWGLSPRPRGTCPTLHDDSLSKTEICGSLTGVGRQEAQDSADQYSSELERLKSTLLRAEEEKRRLEEEAVQIKEMLKREVNRAETESSRNAAIIAEYKQICHRLDNEQGTAKAALNQLRVSKLFGVATFVT